VLELASPIGGPAAHRPCRVDAIVGGDEASSSRSSSSSEAGSANNDVNRQQSIFETSSASVESISSSQSSRGGGSSSSRSSILARLGSKGLGSSNKGVAVKVSNLPADITSTDLKELFSTVGEVLSAQLESSSTAGSGVAGRASVVFATREGASEAVAQFHTRTLDGLPMDVSLANGNGAAGTSSFSSGSDGTRETTTSHGSGAGATTITSSAVAARGSPQGEKSKIPIFASPVMMFNKQGEKYADGEAPSKPGLFFPSLNSARFVRVGVFGVPDLFFLARSLSLSLRSSLLCTTFLFIFNFPFLPVD